MKTAPSTLALPLLALLALLASPATPALRVAAAEPAAGAPRVLTSFLPVHSLALATAGTRASVENWLPPGVDPHDFQFSPRDLRRLREAHLLVIGGLGLEGWTEERLREMSGNPRLRVVEAAAGIPANARIHSAHPHDHDHDHDHGAVSGAGAGSDPSEPVNPHFWLDPLLAAHAVTNIARALADLDPAGAATYAANAAACVGRLHALHRDYEAALGPCRDTPFLTYHDAFPYLARRYQLRLVAVVETSAATDPSARQLADLARLTRREGVRTLFVDGPPPRLARRLAADLGLEIARLETLETGDLRPGAYEDGMRRNLEALRQALQPAARP